MSDVHTDLEAVAEDLAHIHHLLRSRKNGGADVTVRRVAVPHIFDTAVDVILLEGGSEALIKIYSLLEILFFLYIVTSVCGKDGMNDTEFCA